MKDGITGLGIFLFVVGAILTIINVLILHNIQENKFYNCEYNSYNSITKVQANEIITLANTIIDLANNCMVTININQTLEKLDYFDIS